MLTNVEVADEPAHSAMTKPTLITAARPSRSTSLTVGAMTSSTTLGVNAREKKSSSCCSIWFTVSGPSSPDR